MGAEGAEKAMAFRRARSSSGNANAEQARAALVEAFQSADLDRSGMIGKQSTHLLPKPAWQLSPVLTHARCSFSHWSCMRKWYSLNQNRARNAVGKCDSARVRVLHFHQLIGLAHHHLFLVPAMFAQAQASKYVGCCY